MRKSWVLCALLGAMAWGQAQPVQTPPPAAGAGGTPNGAATAATPSAADVPENAAVITIVGVCSAAPKRRRFRKLQLERALLPRSQPIAKR